MAGSRYFVFHEGAVAGPYDAEAIRGWGIAPDTQVCLEGTEEWTLLAQVSELLPPPDPAAAVPTPLPRADGIEITERKKIFIIHGRGNRMEDALDRLIQLVRCKLRYYRTEVYVDAENSNFVRYLLNEAHANPFTVLFERILVGKIVLCPFYPAPSDWSPDASWTKLSEYKVADKLQRHGAPMGTDGSKRAWADTIFQGVWTEFGQRLGMAVANQPALAAALMALRNYLRPPDGGLYLEFEYQQAIRAYFAQFGGDAASFLAMLLEFQRLNDAGGDLDTIASNALYGAWILQAWEAKYGAPPRYGRDFEFDFVNYHQSFLHLARHKNCELYLPDFPMDAIPDLEDAAKAIIEAGSFLVRIDDHHPMGQDKFDLLERLKQAGFFGDYYMSGPVKGTEQPEEERTCGADLVHREMLARRGFDAPGLEELRRLAHQQDLHLIENPDDRQHPDYLAIDLSKLIGSKHSRIDMAQQLMFVRSYEDMRTIMERAGWRQIVDEYERSLEEVCPKLDACVARISFLTRDELEQFRGRQGFLSVLGKIVRAVTFGKVDLELQGIVKNHAQSLHRIHMTLAPFQSRKEHRINVASAIGYMKRHFRFDYFFYAWGASLLTTRRYNDQDQVLDLSQLMPVIGGKGDGGHSSAATCKPPSNASWPAERFKRLNAKNFLEYAHYIAGKVAEGAGVVIIDVRMLTPADRDVAS